MSRQNTSKEKVQRHHEKVNRQKSKDSHQDTKPNPKSYEAAEEIAAQPADDGEAAGAAEATPAAAE
eukprot:364166-Hanusia_phi.AAC.1